MIKNSIKYKLIISFLVVSLIPFALFLIISIKEGKKAIIKNINTNLENHTSLLAKVINSEIVNINKQINLWSKFQILDDIIVNDIDKRIQKFLENIQKNTNLKGIFICCNNDGKIIASTSANLIGRSLSKNYIKQDFTDLHKFKFTDQYAIKFSKPVFASFDKNKLIGYFIFVYYIDNLKKYINITDQEFTLLLNKNKSYFIGQSIDILDKKLKKNGILLIPDYVVVYKQIDNNIFKDKWYMIAAINENYALAPILQINKIFLIISLIGVALIVGTSFFFANKIVKPIESLTSFVQYIMKSKDYTKTMIVNTEDEIGFLAKSFNEMIKEINEAFKSLEKESLERLKLFLKLTETFNKITTAENAENVFEIVNKQLKDFPHIKEVGFSLTKVENSINVKIKTEEINGFLFFKTDTKISLEEERFFKSIGTFVNIWLERLELTKKATQSSKAKSAFIANMSHELRTPLNSIIGFAQFFQMDESLSEEYKELAKNIELSGRHLLELINDILDFSKAEVEKIEINKINLNINSVIQDTVNIVKPLAEEKGLKLEIKIKKDINFKTDIKLLRQIIINLLSNAIKFTSKGKITVKVKKICGKLFISVKDTGIGIEKEKLKFLFQEFTQLENPMQKKHKGTGLGLAITKKYIELLNGKIKVYSKGKNKGTEFIFYIS